jgi:hypothetical protein
LSFGEFPDPSDTCRGNVSERILRECDRANTLRVVDVKVTK